MAKLVTVSGVQIPLEPNRCYLIGRSAKCEVRVDDIASSRRHAQLTVGGTRGAIYVEDLGSRNGTYVNETRITSRRRLRDGNEIRIGASVFIVSLQDDRESDEGGLLDDTGTIGMERLSLGRELGEEMLRVLRAEGPSLTDFAGKLDTFGLVDVLQLLINNRRSGTLHLALDGGHGKVEIRHGEVLAATYVDAQGFDALIALAHEQTGMFWLVEKESHCPRRIQIPTSMLLIELCRAIDEKNSV
ncbi:MAG: FHA domain-containing protein [Planctomycetota bacterium]